MGEMCFQLEEDDQDITDDMKGTLLAEPFKEDGNED